jgi:hypothetical protein
VISKRGINYHTPNNGLFSKNLGKRLSIDETSFSNGELYTKPTKQAKEERNYRSYMIAGTKADTTAIIEKIPLKRNQVRDYPRHGCKYGTRC